MTEAASKE